MANNTDSELRQKLIDHIHRPIAWAKTGKQDDVYAMDVEKTDKLAENMADYALQIIAKDRELAYLDARIDTVKNINLRRYGEYDGTGDNVALPLGNWIEKEAERLELQREKVGKS